MDGYTAFKLWVAIRQHFTTKNFDVFVNKGRIKGKFATYLARSDSPVIDYVASRFQQPQQFVFYVAGNFLYGFANSIWDYSQGAANYNLYVARRKVMGQVVENDLKSLDNMNIRYDDGVNIIRALTRDQITIETVCVINQVNNITNQLRQLAIGKIVEPLLLRIDKSKGFVNVPIGAEKLIKSKLNLN